MKGLEQARNVIKGVFQKAFPGNFMKYKPGMGKTQERQEDQKKDMAGKSIIGIQ